MSATGSVLLDTSMVIDHLRGKNAAVSRQLAAADILYLPVIAVGELLYGANRSSSPAKSLLHVEDFLQLCAILSVGGQTARYYGRIGAKLGRLGTPIPQNDIWIAAIALEHDLPLATHDRHFSLVEGLTLLDW